MRVTYGEFGEGESFLPPDALFPSNAIVEFLFRYGEDGLDALPDLNEQVQALIEEMIQAGLLERDDDGSLRLTPRMVRGVAHRALEEIFRDLRPGVRDGHASPAPGAHGERTDGTKPYEFGDPLGELALGPTMRAAMARAARQSPQRPPLPLVIDERDIEIHQVEATADCALCVLIDLSGSMARYGRHIAAKKVALGLAELVRRKYPLDTVDFIGFASVAEPIEVKDLPLIMPRPVTTRQWEVKVRVPLDQAHLTHPHFTNLHHALRLARRTLARRGAMNKQIFIITDGEPTAHLTGGVETGGEILNLIYPPAESSTSATLGEALACTRAGIRLSTFALIEEYHAMEWVGFVEQMTRLVRGVAYYCAAGDLASTIVESFLSGKRTRRTAG